MNQSNVEVSAVSQAVNSHIAELRDRRDMRVCQLNALLQSLVGPGFESFSGWNDSIRENLLWLAASLAQEVDSLIAQAEELQYPRVDVQ